MALTPEQIKNLTAKHIRIVGAGYVRPIDATDLVRAIEAEVRKDDEALIRQMLEALEWLHLGIGPARDPMRAITAARRSWGQPSGEVDWIGASCHHFLKLEPLGAHPSDKGA